MQLDKIYIITVRKTILDRLQLLLQCSNYLNVFIQNIRYFFVTSDNQLGFKRTDSTDVCIYTVKSIIRYHNHFSSHVYTFFLDASRHSTELITVQKVVNKKCANYFY